MRLRLLLPGGRGGAGLGGLSVGRDLGAPARSSSIRWGPACPIAIWALAIATWGCGSSSPHPRAGARVPASAARPPAGPALGITEDNAALLWSAQAPAALGASGGPAASGGVFSRARQQLSALHPAYVRLLIDWASLQPDPHRAPSLQAGVGGCARAIGPCAPYGGVRDELAAIASQQRTGGGFAVVIDIFGMPAWAAQPASGCERSSHGSFSRAPSAAGLEGYRALIHALVSLGAREGVALDWWAPWNEPNDPSFLSPQRSFCAPDAPPRAPSVYAELARAMASQLRAEGGQRHLLLGEINAYESGASDRLSVAQFVAALPADVVCLGEVWSLHAYAARGRFTPARDPLGVLEQALDARGGCSRGAPIWVTEAGAGAPHPGDSWKLTGREERAGCSELARQLLHWGEDPRVGAVFQYSFREDPSFPVGLVDAKLLHTYSVYRLWLAWARGRGLGSGPPAAASVCG